MTKYRLKKDTPFYKKGTEFCEDWNCKGVLLDDYCSVVANLNELDNPDEWFEEVKEPKWVRKQIKQVLFDDNQLTDNESVWVKMRFLKDFYFEKTDIRGIKHYKAGYELEKVLFKEEREILLPQTIYYINQLVRDGYIEIQDNPNIVWEDEKCD